MIDLTPIIDAVIALAAALATAFLIPWIKKRLSAEDQEKLTFWLKIGVQAAEEYYRGPGQGEAKAEYVRQLLRKKGYDLDVNEVIALINSTVWELIHGKEKVVDANERETVLLSANRSTLAESPL